MIMRWQKVSTAVQSGCDPQAKLENPAECGAGYAEMGGLVQPSLVNGAHWIFSASGGRKSVLRFTEQLGCGSLSTQAKYFQENRGGSQKRHSVNGFDHSHRFTDLRIITVQA